MSEGEINVQTSRVTSRDGLQLPVQIYTWSPSPTRSRKRKHTALATTLIVPDLARTMAAVAPLAEALLRASDRPAKVVTFDAVGRGDASQEPRDLPRRADDLIDICDATGLHHVAIVALGDGVQTFLASAPKRPTLASRVAFIDGGPVFDSVGIARAAALRKKAAAPKDWAEAERVAQAVAPGQFNALNAADWTAIARSLWRENKGRLIPLVPPADPADPDRERPDLWQELAILKRVPALLLRGETSPLMPADLASKIAKFHGRMAVEVVTGQGHVPYLRNDRDVARLVEFLTS